MSTSSWSQRTGVTGGDVLTTPLSEARVYQVWLQEVLEGGEEREDREGKKGGERGEREERVEEV